MPITINGSGTVTGITAGGLPDAIITQPELATGVAGTGPAFSAYQSTSQSVTNATFTKVRLQTEEFDTASCFDSTTNYRFTPTVAGYYQVTGVCNATYAAIASIFKNGGEFKRGIQAASATNLSAALVSALVYMNGSTDYVELYVYQGSGSSVNTSANQSETYFQAAMVRSA
jgi:hypothetical protein